MDALDRELAAALSVEPSPEFRARVRARIVAEPAPSSSWQWWGLAVAGALAAAGMVVFTLPRAKAVAQPDRVEARTVPAEAARPAPRADVVTKPTPATARVEKGSVSAEPEVLIDTYEARAIRALVDRARGEQIELTPLVVAPPPMMEAHAVQAIYIAPIEFRPLTVDVSDRGVPQ
jgi:hypothetical protein